MCIAIADLGAGETCCMISLTSLQIECRFTFVRADKLLCVARQHLTHDVASSVNETPDAVNAWS